MTELSKGGERRRIKPPTDGSHLWLRGTEQFPDQRTGAERRVASYRNMLNALAVDHQLCGDCEFAQLILAHRSRPASEREGVVYDGTLNKRAGCVEHKDGAMYFPVLMECDMRDGQSVQVIVRAWVRPIVEPVATGRKGGREL